MVQDEAEKRFFVVGLGNPGRRYEQTRHNVGFRVVDLLVAKYQAGEGKAAFGGQFWQARPTGPDGESLRLTLFEPHTYMNRSGQAVAELLTFYKARTEDVLVVMDDMNLPPGRLRFRAEGSSGGQKGLADILARLGTQAVPRLRIGIGSPPGRMDGADFVLSKFSSAEIEDVEVTIAEAADAVSDWMFHGLQYAMERHNRRPDE